MYKSKAGFFHSSAYMRISEMENAAVDEGLHFLAWLGKEGMAICAPASLSCDSLLAGVDAHS